MKRLRKIHPGEVLPQEFLMPMNLAASALAREISANTAVRLAGRFGNSAHFWLMLQANFDLEAARNTISRAKTPGKH
jgi:plasmid maintenance system antidote protein VapI